MGADGGGVGPNDDAGTGPVDEGLMRSAKNRVRFKRQERFAADLAQALAIEPANLCAELGQYPCVDVHAISLGGVEPYLAGIFQPLDNTTVSTPIATERIVLTACRDRVDADLSSNAVIFDGLAIDGDGKLTDMTAARAAVDALYKRIVLRVPTAAEVDHLLALYTDLEASEPRPARAWALLTCFAVATSMEALFY